MKKFFLMVSGLIVLTALAHGAEMREWSSGDGSSTMTASVVKVLDSKVVLKKDGGREITVPISKLCDEDQAYLAAYSRELAQERQEAKQAVDLPYKLGEVVGPIEAGRRSSYLLYLPKSLKNSRKAPLLFYSNHDGGHESRLSYLIEGAEINGWIIAMSIESRNDNSDDNEKVCAMAVDHILDTLPVDDDRLYFTGNSGGGAQAFENAGSMDGCGIMPSIAYLPYHVDPSDGDCFILNGAWDFNRYAGARARKKIGDKAIHRIVSGGHSDAPDWMMVDGMAWLQGRYLARRGKKHPDELMDYENSMLDWIGQLKEDETHRAYYWAIFLRDELKVSSVSKAAVEALIEELGKDRLNTLYVEGLDDIDQLSLEHLAKPKDPYHGIVDSDVVEACQELLEKYRGVPVIEETLEALCNKTD